MIRIAVCDDSPEFLGQAIGMVEKMVGAKQNSDRNIPF